MSGDGTLSYIRTVYGVPAGRGMRVVVAEKPGTVTSFRDGRVLVRFDGQRDSVPCHPTWHMVYLLPGGGRWERPCEPPGCGWRGCVGTSTEAVTP